MFIENSDALKKYLMESLGRISDADPGALARYILALLRKPRTEADLKLFFLDQLEVFLMKDTGSFVDELFKTIKSKSYLPQTPVTPKQEKSEKDSIQRMSEKPMRRDKNHHTGTEKNRSLSSSRSRSSSPEKRSLSSHITETVKTEREGLPELATITPPVTTPEYTVHRNDKLSKRCKDYDERGYCLLGDACRFNHGLDPLIVEDVSVLNFAHVLNDTSPPLAVSVCDQKKAPASPPPLPPAPPPPAPPLPPPLPTTEYVPIPEYNPECPAMGGQFYSYQVPSLILPQSLQPRVQSKPLRSRELIGVPTVDSKKDDSRKRKTGGFDYSRLGPKQPKRNFSETTTLELRRVPEASNTITDLHDHFSAFGKIMNIQVCYENDPQASLVTFSSAAEANAAYKSTKAVLNNRFIKVLLHDPDKKNKEKFFAPSDKDMCEKNKDSCQSVIYNSQGHLCKTVYLKRQNNTNLPNVSTVSSETKSVKKEEKKPAVVLSKLDLYKKKQEFLETQIQHQKMIFERLKTAKNPKQRETLKKLLDEVASKITSLQNDLKFFFQKGGEGEKFVSNSQQTQKKFTDRRAEQKKELLDAEMDLYKTLNSGDCGDGVSMLLTKVHELKEKAKAYGLLDSYEKTPKKRPLPHSFSKTVMNSKLLKTDNRPRTLLVTGIEDKEFFVTFLQKFPNFMVEKISSAAVPKGCIVTLSTRKGAETMLRTLNGFTLGDETLSLTWFHDDQQLISEDVKDAKEKDSINFVDEDEDEEEDSEARSWRR